MKRRGPGQDWSPCLVPWVRAARWFCWNRTLKLISGQQRLLRFNLKVSLPVVKFVNVYEYESIKTRFRPEPDKRTMSTTVPVSILMDAQLPGTGSGRRVSQLVEIFVSQDLVEDPVEDVEEEEGQREAGPRHRVDLFGAVDEQLPHLLHALTAAASRCILGSVGRGPRAAQRRHGVIGAEFGLFDAAGSRGDGSWGGQPAFMDIHVLLGGKRRRKMKPSLSSCVKQKLNKTNPMFDFHEKFLNIFRFKL